MKSEYADLRRALLARMEHYDRELQKRIEEDGTEITCKRGCSHCCYLLTTIHPLEGLLLAEEVLKQPHWRRKAVELSENARECHAAGSNRAEYFKKGIPCPFLDLGTGDCQVYHVRPVPCRYHVVVSPVENCFRTYVGTEIGCLDTTVALAGLLKFCMDTTQIGAASPIAPMVLWCMEQLLGGKGNRNFVKRLRKGLPHPLKWMETALENWDFETDTESYIAARRDAFSQVWGKDHLRYYDAVLKAKRRRHVGHGDGQRDGGADEHSCQ